MLINGIRCKIKTKRIKNLHLEKVIHRWIKIINKSKDVGFSEEEEIVKMLCDSSGISILLQTKMLLSLFGSKIEFPKTKLWMQILPIKFIENHMALKIFSKILSQYSTTFLFKKTTLILFNNMKLV